MVFQVNFGSILLKNKLIPSFPRRTANAITAFSTNSSTGSVFYACTAGQEFFAINSQTGDIIRRSPTVSIYSHLAHGTNVILSGGSDGYIRSHDPRTSSTVNAVQAHVSGVQGLLASGNFICSIGLGTRYIPLIM